MGDTRKPNICYPASLQWELRSFNTDKDLRQCFTAGLTILCSQEPWWTTLWRSWSSPRWQCWPASTSWSWSSTLWRGPAHGWVEWRVCRWWTRSPHNPSRPPSPSLPPPPILFSSSSSRPPASDAGAPQRHSGAGPPPLWSLPTTTSLFSTSPALSIFSLSVAWPCHPPASIHVTGRRTGKAQRLGPFFFWVRRDIGPAAAAAGQKLIDKFWAPSSGDKSSKIISSTNFLMFRPCTSLLFHIPALYTCGTYFLQQNMLSYCWWPALFSFYCRWCHKTHAPPKVRGSRERFRRRWCFFWPRPLRRWRGVVLDVVLLGGGAWVSRIKINSWNPGYSPFFPAAIQQVPPISTPKYKYQLRNIRNHKYKNTHKQKHQYYKTHKGRVGLPKRMNFRRTSKGGGHFQSKNCCCRFWTFI